MKLSIIVISCGQAMEIGNMLQEVSIQTKADQSDFEIIVADDFSKDPTLGTLRDFLPKLFRFARVVESDRKRFTGGIRNLAASIAVGEWLWFVDGDDAIVPSAVERILAAIETARTDCLVLDYLVEKADCKNNVSFHVKDPGVDLKVWNVGVMAWFKVIRKSAFVEFREARSEDNDWWVRQCVALVKSHGSGFDTVPGGPCLVYRSLAPGAFTTALERFRAANGVAASARLLVRDDVAAAAVADCLNAFAEMVRLSFCLKRETMPEDFIAHHEWALRWWLGVFLKGNEQ